MPKCDTLPDTELMSKTAQGLKGADTMLDEVEAFACLETSWKSMKLRRRSYRYAFLMQALDIKLYRKWENTAPQELFDEA